MARHVVTVFGASGFIGRHLVRRLAATGAIVRAAVTDVERAAFLKPMGDVGQVLPIRADIRNEAQVAQAVAGADVVINLVGILFERGARKFAAIHAEGAERVARAAKAAGVKRFVHMSALGADSESPSAYARSKAEGEKRVRQAFPEAAIFRPSVVFGPEDDFFNRFAALAQFSPVLPVFAADAWKIEIDGLNSRVVPFGSGGTKFQPVYVGDVADAMMAAAQGRMDTAGRTFELGGPRVYAMKEIMELVVREVRRDCLIAPLPLWTAAIMAKFLQFLPKPPLTPDHVLLLKRDNLVSANARGLADLGITPATAEAIVPDYLARYRPPVRQARLPA